MYLPDPKVFEKEIPKMTNAQLSAFHKYFSQMLGRSERKKIDNHEDESPTSYMIFDLLKAIKWEYVFHPSRRKGNGV